MHRDLVMAWNRLSECRATPSAFGVRPTTGALCVRCEAYFGSRGCSDGRRGEVG